MLKWLSGISDWILHDRLLHRLRSWSWHFLNFDISQGSVVTQLRCGEIISQGFVANLLVNLPVKEFWKSVNIWRRYGQYCSALFFWLTVYIFFGFYKTIHILLSDSANCTVLHAVVLTIPACDGQTDGQTDGIAVASTALARRALRRAVKTSRIVVDYFLLVDYLSSRLSTSGGSLTPRNLTFQCFQLKLKGKVVVVYAVDCDIGSRWFKANGMIGLWEHRSSTQVYTDYFMWIFV